MLMEKKTVRTGPITGPSEETKNNSDWNYSWKVRDKKLTIQEHVLENKQKFLSRKVRGVWKKSVSTAS